MTSNVYKNSDSQKESMIYKEKKSRRKNMGDVAENPQRTQELSTGESALCLTGVPISRMYQMSGLVGVIRSRGLLTGFNQFRKDLYTQLVSNIKNTFVDTQLGVQKSWFLVRKTGVIDQEESIDSQEPESEQEQELISEPLIVIGTENENVRNFLSDKNTKHEQSVEKQIKAKAGKRLTGDLKISQADKADPAILDAKKIAKEKALVGIRETVRAEIDGKVMRTRMFRLYGTKSQYAYLRRQRGSCRYLYNQCLRDMRHKKNENRFLVEYLHWLLNEETLTDSQISNIRAEIFKYTTIDTKELRDKYQNDRYWIDNGKTWFVNTTTSNLRTAVIEQLATNITTAKKQAHEAGRAFGGMSFLTKRDDMYSFTIPVDKQQVNKGTGKLLDPALPQPKRFAIKFQYECTKCPNRGVFTVWVRKEDRFPQTSDFECNPKIVYKNGLYYIALTESVQIQPSSIHVDSVVPQPLRIASADPGIATFLTVFLPHERSVYSIATSKDSLDRIKNTKRQFSYHARLERLRRKESKMWSQVAALGKGETTRKIRKRMKRIQRAIGKRRQKKKNLVDELHFKTVNFIWNNADVFMMPYFDTERFLQSNRMRKKTKRAMRDLNFSLFRERLVAKAETQGKIWLEVTEAYSTKECLICGHINRMSLKDRTFCCAQCEHTLPRDVKSSIDIYTRNASEIVLT